MDLLALAARLTLDKSQYDQGLDDASKGAKSFGDKLKSGLGAAAKVGAAAIATVATAAGAMTTALVKGAGEVAAFGDNIDKASQKIGFSAEAYQEWDAVLQHSGSSIENLTPALKTLSAKAQSGSDAFTKLGISQKEAASMTREQLFERTITALQGVSDETQRAALAQELLGKGAMELGPLLNTSAVDTQAMRDRVHELGGVMSNEAVKAAAAYQDALQDMTTAMDGAKRNLMAEFLPSITTVMEGLTELFSGGDGVGKISEGINQFIDKLSAAVPKVLDVGANIVMKLADAVIQNLPKLIQAATKTIITLATGIVKELPTLVKAGLQIILELARGIAEALPELIPTIVEVVMEIVDVLTDPDTLSQLIDAAIQIMIALAFGIVDAIPKLLEKVPLIISNLVEAFVSNAPKMIELGARLLAALGEGIITGAAYAIKAVLEIGSVITGAIGDLIKNAWEWGKDLILNFWNGIVDFVSYPIKAISDMLSNIFSLIHFSEPDEGPLSDFHTYAPDMMKEFARGITDNAGLVEDAISDAFNFGTRMTGSVPVGETIIPRETAGTGSQMLNIILELDGVQFARAIYNANKQETQRLGVQLSEVTF